MDRRRFLGAAAASTLLGRFAWAESFPSDLKITRIVSFDLHTRRSKTVGKNAVRGDHGGSSMDRMARLYTNMGVEAVGRCWKDREALEPLLGRNPFEHFDLASRRMPGPLGCRTMVLWDLAGKILQQPVYRLLGGTKSGKVPVYDGSIYFSDLMTQHAARWKDRFKEEIDQSMAAGHRAFKIKIGRGKKWMPREAGDARDIEVLQTIRQHAGDDVRLGVDANNAFDLPGAKRFLQRAEGLDLEFLEEPFPEEVEPCRELKRFIAERGWKTMLADGEGTDDVEAYRPLVDAKAVDMLQGDMYGLGIEGILAEAAMGHPQGILVAPHNWSSLLSLFMQVHMGLVVPNFYRAEHDPLSTDVLSYDGYKIEDGCCSVPDAPGFGLAIDERKFERVSVNFELRT
ncbi:MAG TPA: enolase C-terminal domain-like protein [Thermoguttaceae bacterium]|nr:enolase C-terminal domain-like protein [Thermoguttaceae bacterium]